MSGILLPGQERRPEGEGKIELPKGMTPPKKEAPAQEPPTAPAASPAPPSGRPTPPNAGRGRGQPGPELLFPPRAVQVRCPSCGTPYAVPVFTIIDLGANPELRGPLLGGQVNVGVCPNCGAGGALGAPLMVHDPEHNFLGVYVPMESGRDEVQRQKAIGDLTQALMRKIPSETRRGYMLQPQQYVDWQRFMEKLWEFEGVTPEMLRRQREQSSLLQNLLSLANDEKALEIALSRGGNLVDRDFFALLDQIILAARSQGQGEELQLLMNLREQLLNKTEAGKLVKKQQDKIRGLLAQITPQSTRDDILDLVIDAWQGEDGPQVVGTLAVAVSTLVDYQFLLALTERIDQTPTAEAKAELEKLRQFLLEMQEQVMARQRQAQEAMAQQAQVLIQEVLQAPNPAAVLREHIEDVDEAFLSLLAANAQQAERSNATAAARRLRQIYELAVSVLRENMPQDVRLLNDLLGAPDEAATRQLLKDNRSLLTKEFVDALRPIEAEMREGGRADVADRIKSLRAQISLMM